MNIGSTGGLSICLVSQEYPPETGWGGIGSYVYEMARALNRLGHRVTVLSQAQKIAKHLNEDGIDVYRIVPSGGLRNVPFFWRGQRYWDGTRQSVARELNSIVERHQIDIIEAPEARAEILWYQCLFANRPATVIKLHTPRWLVDQLNNTQINIWNHLEYIAEREMIKRADIVTSCSHALLERSHKWLPQRDYSVVHNPISLHQDSSSTDLSCEVMFHGRLEWNKGIQVFRDVIPLVLSECDNVKFTLSGSDGAWPGGSSLLKYVLEGLSLEQQSCLTFTGCLPRTDILTKLSSRPICVLPSLWENFPYACLEAMASGCAVVGSRNGGMAEMIEDGVTGFLVDPLNAREISERILLLLNDPARRLTMGTTAARIVRERFSGAAIAARTVDIYREAISRRGRA